MLCSVLIPAAPPASAATNQVQVRIPAFNVELNGVSIDNLHQDFPLLVYKDITYFPMTWDFSRALSLTVNWSQEGGLSLLRNNQYREKPKQSLNSNNDLNRSYTAAVAGYPINVNWQYLDNANEPYPVLQFRDITYFPMTWRFTHDEFEWDTSWDNTAGFKLTTIQHKVLYDLLYDEGDSLYAGDNRGDIYEVGKGLGDLPPVKLSKEAAMDIEKKAGDRFRPFLASSFASKEEKAELKGDNIYFKQTELLSLSSAVEQYKDAYPGASPKLENISVGSIAIPVNDDITFVHLTVYFAPRDIFTPQRSFTFIVKDGKAVQVPEFDQLPNYFIPNPDGSHWMISVAPDRVSARSAGMRGQILHIAPDGTTTSMNRQLDADNIDLLYVDHGALTVKVYNNLFPPNQSKETDGIYRLDVARHAVKLHDYMPGDFYIDSSQKLYLVDGMKNRITDLTDNVSKYWWDYELITDLY